MELFTNWLYFWCMGSPDFVWTGFRKCGKPPADSASLCVETAQIAGFYGVLLHRRSVAGDAEFSNSIRPQSLTLLSQDA
jgi:hypothetical protein